MPLNVEEMRTYPMQHYLDAELVERLGFADEAFESGSFTVREHASAASRGPEETKAEVQVDDAS